MLPSTPANPLTALLVALAVFPVALAGWGFVSSNREGGYGGLDLYLMTPNPFKDTARYIHYLAGSVVDSTTGSGIGGARVSVRGGDGNVQELTADRSGKYRLRTHPGEQIELAAAAQNYEPRSMRFKIPGILTYNEYRKSIALPPIPQKEAEKPDTTRIPGLIVYFDFDKYDLSSLRIIGSVGEPLNPEAFEWYYEVIGKKRCPILDTWWQTETGMHMITTMIGEPMRPGFAGKPIPGVEADVVDKEGTPVKPGTGGLLVVKKPWPAMLRTVYKDDERYRKYWYTINGVYAVGDLAGPPLRSSACVANSRSTAKPMAGSGRPNRASRPSYRPPPSSAFCAPSTSLVISKVVRV